MIRARFFVAGEPATQGSKRIVQPKGHRRPMLIEVSQKLPAWRTAVGAEAIQARARLGRQLTGPLTLKACFYLRRPKRPKSSYPRLDCDKLARGLLDGICENGGLIEDDSQFVKIEIEKRYAETWTGQNGQMTGCDVEIRDA